MRAILLNGPPGVGKDTIGGMVLARIPSASTHKFAKPIVDFMWYSLGIDMLLVDKDAVHPKLNGRTPRQVAIQYSEGFCKPLWGVDYFGHEAVRELRRRGSRIAVFTDSGFAAEAIPVATALGKGKVLQVILTRPGHHFHADSRSWWNHPDVGHLEFDNNCKDLRDLSDKVNSDLIPEIQQWLVHSS